MSRRDHDPESSHPLSEVELEGLLAATYSGLVEHARQHADPIPSLLALLKVDEDTEWVGSDVVAQLSTDTVVPRSSAVLRWLTHRVHVHNLRLVRDLRIGRLQIRGSVNDLVSALDRAFERESERRLESDSDRHLVSGLDRAYAGDVGRAVVRVRVLLGAIDHVLAHENEFDTRLDRDRRRLIYVLISDRDLIRDLDRVLESALVDAFGHDLVQDLVNALDRAIDRNVSNAVNHARSRALDIPLSLAVQTAKLLLAAVEAIPVDASGVDLTTLRVDDLAALVEVVWDENTRWPTEWREQVHEHSEDLGNGRYRIHGGSQRNKSKEPVR